MKTRSFVILFVGAASLLTVTAYGQSAPQTPQPAQPPVAAPLSPPAASPAPAQPAPADVGKVFVPDLGDFMAGAQRSHEKLWLSGNARNWPLAEYNLAELKETLSSVEDFVPKYNGIPVGDMIDTVVTGPIVDLEKAVAAKDFKQFATSFDALTQACNSCHQAAQHEFIVIQRPAQSSFPNQDFRPHKQ